MQIVEPAMTSSLESFFDHTCLKPDASFMDIDKLCEEAAEHRFYSVCVAPSWVKHAKERLQDLKSNVKICTVVGFPHGNTTIESKVKLIEELKEVVDEFDVVIDIGKIKSGWWSDIDLEVKAIKATGATIKYIVEVGYLNEDELHGAIRHLSRHRIDFIKTCTGYGPRNVTIEDIKAIKRYTGGRPEIKASGGIKTKEFALALINAGAGRIGSSSSVAIVTDES